MAVYEYLTGMIQALATGKPVKFPKIDTQNVYREIEDFKAAAAIFEQIVGDLQEEKKIPRRGDLPVKPIMDRAEEAFDAAFGEPWKKNGRNLQKTFRDERQMELAMTVIHAIADSQGDEFAMCGISSIDDYLTYRINEGLMADMFVRAGRGRIR